LLTSLCCLQAGAVSSEIRSLSVSDGLPDLVINTIYKDSKGYVWMGTNTSVERFDGIRLEHYMVEGSNENLPSASSINTKPSREPISF
jgi:ligand-binding sensor domain-containing protein